MCVRERRLYNFYFNKQLVIVFILCVPDMDDDCFPAITLRSTQRLSRDTDSPIIVVKDEPMSEPESPISSCPPSPSPSPIVFTDYKYEHKVRSIKILFG